MTMTDKLHTKRISGVLPAVLAMLLLSGMLMGCSAAGVETSALNQPQEQVRAPEFPKGLEWLNTSEPLTMADLRGKVVLLDFWTYCCINCIHIMPDLKKLEAKYPDELVVIGVHSAKFEGERETENIRQAVLRYELEHPVVNDNQLRIWREYGVRAWPTLVLVGPDGYVVGARSGENIYDTFDQAISQVIAHYDAKGEINRDPIAKIRPEMETERRALLNFPGKVLADGAGNRLFIADSNNNRIVVVSLDNNEVTNIIGSGEAGLDDGGYMEATFDKPQGMAIDGDTLYVADTENHAIRRIDLKEKTVTTIAGTGQQARAFNKSGPAMTTALNSPWALVLQDNTLFIANAGSHQLWRMDLEKGFVEPHAGSGRENRTDGSLGQAALAQPSGLTTDGTKLYFADSEVSAIRAADIDQSGSVETVAGGELFEFGDVDARGLKARFQHPLGVAYKDGWLYVADTYNNKIRRIEVKSGKAETFLGNGEGGMRDGKGERATFDEPGGVSILGNKLYIADTNNHLIRVADLETREVTTLIKSNMERLTEQQAHIADREAMELPLQQIKTGTSTVRFDLKLGPGLKLNDLATSTITWQLGDGTPQRREVKGFPLEISLGDIAANTTLRADYSIYYCTNDNRGLCYFGEGSLLLPIEVSTDGDSSAKITISPDSK